MSAPGRSEALIAQPSAQATPTMAVIDATAMRAALARWCDALDAAAPELNALDARLGDGDLGTTLVKCAANVRAVLRTDPAGLGATLKGCAMACARASGSSFGTLLSVAFLTAAKAVGAQERLERDGLVALLDLVQQALAQRGGAAPGDKTMLDSIGSIEQALHACAPDADARTLVAAAQRAAAGALDAFRDRPNRIGRARMFADQSVGLDDPGMVAVQRMVEAL
jgi:phosphoenolpyruvate---glycerone phosphotransferase subunit DhaL